MTSSTAQTNKIDYSKVDEILKKYEYKKTSLITILQETQAVFNYLPEEVMTYIGTKTEASPATVFGVATFYAQFSLEPKGKHVLKICDGTACHVRGSRPVYEAVIERLNLVNGKFTTPDGQFSVETVSCLGACSLAPAVVVDEKVYPKMTPDAVLAIIENLMEEK